MKKWIWVVVVPVLVIALTVVGLLRTTSQAQANSVSKNNFGNHNLNGTYAFSADGVIDAEGGGYVRGMWEVGRFEADGAGNMMNGVEYSSLLSSSDPSVIDQPYSFSGTYQINPDGTAKAHVTVVVNPELTIEKDLWFIIHSVGKDGIANGFVGGHADADLGGPHGNSQTHQGYRMDISK